MARFKVTIEFGESETESYQIIEIDALTATEAEETALATLDDRVSPYVLTYWAKEID